MIFFIFVRLLPMKQMRIQPPLRHIYDIKTRNDYTKHRFLWRKRSNLFKNVPMCDWCQS